MQPSVSRMELQPLMSRVTELLQEKISPQCPAAALKGSVAEIRKILIVIILRYNEITNGFSPWIKKKLEVYN